VTYETGDRLELVTSVSEEVWLKLKCVQDLLSQKLKRPASIEEALAAMTDSYLQKHDPVLRADRALERKKKREASSSSIGTCALDHAAQDKHVTCRNSASAPVTKAHCQGNKRTPIPAHVKNAVIARDGRQCTAIGADGKRCMNRRWLHLHHILEVSRGGANEFENITSLCEGHHRAVHHAGQAIALMRESLSLGGAESIREL
jgi:hypothetical protein